MQHLPPTPPFSRARMPENEPVRFDIESANITYPGEVVRAKAWHPDLGANVPSGVAFRIVLLAERGKISEAPQPIDPRVVVCFPDTQAKVAEPQATYDTSAPPPFLDTFDFVKGVVLQSSGREPRAADVYAQQSWPSALQLLVEHIVGAVASPPPLDLGGLTRAVTPDDVALLWRGLVPREHTPDVIAALRAYAPALRLASSEAPELLVSSAPAIEPLIEQVLPQGPASFADLLARCSDALSLPPYLAAFYLLTALRTKGETYEITLREGHAVRWLNDEPFPGDRLTDDYLPSVRWDAALIEDCESMRLATDATWTALRPALSRMIPSEELADGSEVAVLRRHSQEMAEAQEPLKRLIDATQAPDADRLSGALDRLLSLLRAETPQAFQSELQRLFRTFDDFLSEARLYTGLRAGSDAAEEIALIPVYLERAALGGGQAELEVERLAILEQTNVSELVRQPSLLLQLQHQFQLFRTRYRNVYEARHRTQQAKAREIHAALESGESQVAALRRLNAIHEIGPEVGTTALAPYPRLLEMTVSCDIATEDMALDAQPICPPLRFQPRRHHAGRGGAGASATSPGRNAGAVPAHQLPHH